MSKSAVELRILLHFEGKNFILSRFGYFDVLPRCNEFISLDKAYYELTKYSAVDHPNFIVKEIHHILSETGEQKILIYIVPYHT